MKRRMLMVAAVLVLSMILMAPAAAVAGVGPAPKTTGDIVLRSYDSGVGTTIEYRLSWNAHVAFGDRPAKGNLTYQYVEVFPDGTESVLWSVTWPVTAASQIDDTTYQFTAPGSYAWAPGDGESSQYWSGGVWRVIDAGEPGVDDNIALWCTWCSTFHYWFDVSGGNIQAH